MKSIGAGVAAIAALLLLTPGALGSWPTPQKVSTGTTTNNTGPEIALDSDGNPNVVWSGNDGSTKQVYYAKNTGSGWTPQKVSSGTGMNTGAKIALDSDGNPNVVWSGNDGSTKQVYYAENTGSGWTPQKVSTGTSTLNQDPQIALDSDGNPNVVWSGLSGSSRQVYFAENTGSGWFPQLVSTGTSTGNTWPQIEIDPTGYPNVVWEGNDGSTKHVYYAEKRVGIGWIPQRVSSTTTTNDSPRITLDQPGNPNVVWCGYEGSARHIYYAENTGGGWTGHRVSSATSTDNFNPEIALDYAGNPNVAWDSGAGNRHVYYAGNTGSGWTPQDVSQGISMTGMFAEIALDPAGNPNLVWEGMPSAADPTNNIYYAENTGGGWTAQRVSTNSVDNFSPRIALDTAGNPNVAWYGEDGSTDQVYYSVANPLYSWYLAEGTTAWGFSTCISIENPNTIPVEVTVTYMPKGAGNVTETITLPAGSQTTLTNDHLVQKMGGVYDFSTRVEAADSRMPIAVDRTMSWSGGESGASGKGSAPEGHSSIGVTSPATTWYLPEGSTNWDFETWLLIQNPNGSEASCDVTYMIEGADPVTVNHVVPANSRESYSMLSDVGAADASIKVTAGIPIIPERAMYRYSRREGHDSIGTTTPALDYYLAEGAVGYDSGYTTYILVQNPQGTATDVQLTFLTGSGSVPGPTCQMPANSRKTFKVNDYLPPNTDVSTMVHGSQAVIAERAMYWNSPAGEACHDSIGMSSPADTFYLPDGETGNGRETWTLVQNPNETEVQVTISYLTPTGAGNVTKTETVPANSRSTFNMLEHSGINGRASIEAASTTTGKKIMVERAMYWDSRNAGTNTIGGSLD